MESASDFNPYEGRSARGWPVLTMSRGEVIMSEDQILSTPGRGRMLRQARLRAARSTSAWEPGEPGHATKAEHTLAVSTPRQQNRLA